MKFVLIFALIFLCFPSLTEAEPVVRNGVLVRVNDAVITYKDIQNRIADDLAFLERQYGNQPKVFDQKLAELEKQHIELLVEEQLILHEFKTGGYRLPDSWIEDRINKDIRTYRNRLTLTQTLQAQGMTYEGYRTKVRDRVIIEAMMDQNVPRDPVISPFKIESYYVQNRDKFNVQDQVKLRMIVITNRPNDNLFAPKKMTQEILAKIEEGATFAEMAKIYSQGSQSTEGGDWGWVERSVLRADLAEKAFGLKPGQRSGVIEAPDGCYLMQVDESRTSFIKPLSEVREEIESTLKTEESRRLKKKWIDRLKSKSFLLYF
jgi:peptidyl-prolyl cis-trans isomerase SurA